MCLQNDKGKFMRIQGIKLYNQNAAVQKQPPFGTTPLVSKPVLALGDRIVEILPWNISKKRYRITLLANWEEYRHSPIWAEGQDFPYQISVETRSPLDLIHRGNLPISEAQQLEIEKELLGSEPNILDRCKIAKELRYKSILDIISDSVKYRQMIIKNMIINEHDPSSIGITNFKNVMEQEKRRLIETY